MIVEKAKLQLREAMKAQKTNTKNILRVVLGDLETAELQKKRPLTSDEEMKVVYKRIQSNKEVIAMDGTDSMRETLKQEIAALHELVPVQITEDEIEHLLSLHALSNIVNEANGGKAIGLANKALAELKVQADGKLVKTVVERLRAEHATQHEALSDNVS